MHSHESETTVAPDGSVHVAHAPFPAGSRVRVILLELLEADRASRPDVKAIRDRLRGTVKYYNDPFGPACDPSDWDATRSDGEPPEASTR